MPLSLLHYLFQIVNVVFRQRWNNLGGRLQPIEPTTCVQLSGKYTPWVPEEIHITSQSCVCSFNGLIDQTSLTLVSGFSHIYITYIVGPHYKPLTSISLNSYCATSSTTLCPFDFKLKFNHDRCCQVISPTHTRPCIFVFHCWKELPTDQEFAYGK